MCVGGVRLHIRKWWGIMVLKIVRPVSWVCRIRRLHLCRRVRPLPNKCPEYDIKPSDSDAPVLKQ